MLFLALLLTLSIAAPVAAASYDLPKRKSGLWEIKMSSAQMKGMQAMQQCVDQKTDNLMMKNMAETQTQCSKNEVRKEGDKVIAESVCKMGNSTATTRAVFTGRFDSTYKADVKTTYEPPYRGMKEASSTIEANWLGPCNPGQKPGDMTMPGMPNINIDELMKQGGAGKRP